MLDEIREFEQYTEDINEIKGKEGRLTKRPLNKSYGGIPRAMLIIARHYMFQNPDFTKEEQVEYARKALRIWCGARKEGDEVEDSEKIDSWIIRYAVKLGLDEDKITQLKEKPQSYEKTIYSLEDKNQEKKKKEKKKKTNDQNKILYDHVLAEAMAMGKLKRRYLVCEGDPFKDNLICNGMQKISDGKRGQNDKDKILKFTAAYLVGKSREEQATVCIKLVDLVNGIQVSSLENKDLVSFVYREENDSIENGMPLIRKIKIGNSKNNNRCAYKLPKSWTDRFQVVDEEDLDHVLDQMVNPIFFSDLGAGHSLLEGQGKRY